MSKDLTINTSMEKKRGIFVYTPSREKDRKSNFDNQGSSFNILR